MVNGNMKTIFGVFLVTNRCNSAFSVSNRTAFPWFSYNTVYTAFARNQKLMT